MSNIPPIYDEMSSPLVRRLLGDTSVTDEEIKIYNALMHRSYGGKARFWCSTPTTDRQLEK